MSVSNNSKHLAILVNGILHVQSKVGTHATKDSTVLLDSPILSFSFAPQSDVLLVVTKDGVAGNFH
jgi:hypothetical protein